MTKWRYTVESLASGQPSAYADTIQHVRVTLESDNHGIHGQTDFTPLAGWKEDSVARLLKGLMCGFTDFKYPPADRPATMDDHFQTRLDWLREVEPGVWEFHTTSAFTD